MTHAGLLASHWTLAGSVMPRGSSLVGRHSFEARTRAAAQAGYQGVGLMHEDVRHIAARLRFPAMRAQLDACGLKHLELEFLTDWFAQGERRRAADALEAELFQAAQALGARHVKVGGDRHGLEWPMDRVAESFAALCERARAHGTTVALELLPWTQFDTVAKGRALLERAGWPSHGGLLLDVWHLDRVGQDWSEIAGLPAAAIVSVELSDAGDVTHDTWDDTIRRRRYCGEGTIDLAGFIRAVHATGYQGPWGVEIISDAHRALALEAAAIRPFDTTRAALIAAGAWA